MASPARIAKPLPATLPADFGEWDESAGSPQPDETAPAQPAPEPHTAPASNAAPPAQAESSRHRIPAPQQKVFASDKAFLDQLISVHPETGAPNRISAQHPASAGAIYEVLSPRPVSSRSRTETRPESRLESRLDRSHRARIETRPPRPAPRETAKAQPGAVALPSFAPQPDESASRKLFLAALARIGLARNRKWAVALAAAAASVLALLLFLAFAVGRTGRHASNVRPAQSQPAAPVAYPSQDVPKPSPADPLSAVQVTAAPVQPSDPAQSAQTASAAQDPPPADAPAPPQVQSQMMNDQLSAPAKITPEMKTKPSDDAPPATLDASGLGGSASPGSVLSAQAAPHVQAAPPKFVNVSAGVAIGLLVQSTPPIYPAIARTARVSGTVVLEATISKAGAIENLRMVSGPAMLRQAALDAVHTWRYKPYKVNNQPTAIETTINVVFKLQ